MDNVSERLKNNRYEKIIEVATWAVLIVIIFGVRFLPIKLLDNDSVYILIGGITSFALLYYLVIYKVFARSKRFYFKMIGDVVLIGVLIHLLKDFGQYFFALYFLPIAAAALELEFISALLIATIASLFVILEIFLNSFELIPNQASNYFQGVWQIVIILFITIFCRMLAIQLRQEKTAKEESLARQKLLEEEAIRQREFLSMTSHQLFTPLSMIRGFVSMLKDENLGKINPKQKEAVGEIYDNAVRMVNLITELLSVSRIQNGTYEVNKKSTDINDLIANVIISCGKTLNKNKLAINFQKGSLKPVTVDTDKVRQVLCNLLDNALKYSKQGEINISTKQANEFTIVSVSDQGVGVEKEDLDKLFQPFFRGSNSFAIDNKGSGLGLYISRLIIEKHGGKIWAERNSKAGTTFTFTLPNK